MLRPAEKKKKKKKKKSEERREESKGGTYFDPFLGVEAVVVADLVGWTWGYWWGWSVRNHSGGELCGAEEGDYLFSPDGGSELKREREREREIEKLRVAERN